MSTFCIAIRISNVDDGLEAFKESARDGTADHFGETAIGVQSLQIERHFDASELLIQLAITAPVSVTTAVIAGQINEYIKRKLNKPSDVIVANTKAELANQDELTRVLQEAIVRAVEAERSK